MIKVITVFEWMYRAVVLYLLYNCWSILEAFVSLAIRIYG